MGVPGRLPQSWMQFCGNPLKYDSGGVPGAPEQHDAGRNAYHSIMNRLPSAKEKACFVALDFISRYALLLCPHPKEGKLGGRLDKQHDEIVKALSDINAFIVEKKRDKAAEMPTKLVDKIVVHSLAKRGGHRRQKIAITIRLLGLSTSLTISVKADGRGQCARNGKLPEKAGR